MAFRKIRDLADARTVTNGVSGGLQLRRERVAHDQT